MADDEKESLIFRQRKDNNSYIADDTLMKLNMNNHNMFIYIQYLICKFNGIPSLFYLVMAEDGKSLKLRVSKGN